MTPGSSEPGIANSCRRAMKSSHFDLVDRNRFVDGAPPRMLGKVTPPEGGQAGSHEGPDPGPGPAPIPT